MRDILKKIIMNTKNDYPTQQCLKLGNITHNPCIISVSDLVTTSFEGATPNKHRFECSTVHTFDIVMKFKNDTDNYQCYRFLRDFFESLDFIDNISKFDSVISPNTRVNEVGDITIKKDFRTGLFRAEFTTDYLPKLPLPTEEELEKNRISVFKANVTYADIIIHNLKNPEKSETRRLPFGMILN